MTRFILLANFVISALIQENKKLVTFTLDNPDVLSFDRTTLTA